MLPTAILCNYNFLIKDNLIINADYTLWYIGSNYSRLSLLKKKYEGKIKIAQVGNILNDTATSLLPLILNIDKELSTKEFDRSSWNASDVGDRSRHNSPLFLELTKAIALLSSISRGEANFIVVDTDASAIMIYNTLKKNGFKVKWLGKSNQLKKISMTLTSKYKQLRSLIGNTYNTVSRCYRLRKIRIKHPLSLDEIRSVQVWIIVWATELTFNAGKVLDCEERAGRMPQILRRAGFKLGYIVFPLWPEKFQTIVASAILCSEPVIFVEDTVNFTKIITSSIRSMRVAKGASKKLIWSGWNLSPVLSYARIAESRSGRPFQAELIRYIPSYLNYSKSYPLSIVTTYENHNWEKVLTESVRNNLPSTSLVGHNHASFSSFYVSMNPTQGEIDANVIPDLVLALGKNSVEKLSSRGFPLNRLKIAGGLRYEKFISNKNLPSQLSRSQNKILCCPGVDIDEAFELVSKVANAITDNKQISLIVNFHPMCGKEFREKLKALLLADNTPGFNLIQFDDRSVQSILHDVSVVLYIDSNAAIEAAAAGKLVIYVQRDIGLNYDKMPDSMSVHCQTSGQIREALKQQVDLQRTSDILKSCISPVNEEVIINAVIGKQNDS